MVCTGTVAGADKTFSVVVIVRPVLARELSWHFPHPGEIRMKTALVVTAALALTSPLAVAEDKQPPKPAAKTEAAKSHSKQSTSDRQVAKKLMATGVGMATLGAAGKPETRDWAAIDTNGDHLISPDEMQKYLDASWAAQKKK
jgi:hypothetical protein